MDNQSKIEKRLDYLSVQVDRLVEQHHDTTSPLASFRKAAMLTGQTFEQEMAAMKILGATYSFRKGESLDLSAGLLPIPDDVIKSFDEYASKAEITPEEERELLQMVIGGGESAALDLQKAWNESSNTTPTQQGQ